MEFKDVQIERKGSTAIVSIHRPQALNALNYETIQQLTQVFVALENDPAVAAIILTGSGTKAFVAGADIKELAQLNYMTSLHFVQFGQALMEKVETLRQPVIAAINGFALGGGCELALACDIRVALDTAQLGLPEVSLGLIPGFGGTQRLARLVGRGKAKQLIFSGDRIDAAEAQRIGLVDEIVKADWLEEAQPDGTIKRKIDGEKSKAKLLKFAEDLAAKMGKHSQIAIQTAKRAINHGLDMSLRDGNAFEANVFTGLFSTADTGEGLAAFIEKRTPNFKNE